jgi:hypothetical protein
MIINNARSQQFWSSVCSGILEVAYCSRMDSDAKRMPLGLLVCFSARAPRTIDQVDQQRRHRRDEVFMVDSLAGSASRHFAK